MKRVNQVFLRPGWYRVGARMVRLASEDLSQLASNTKKMLESGIRIPLWPSHCQPGDANGGPQTETCDASENKGWLVDLEQLADGSLQQTLEVTDEKIAGAMEKDSVRFTSPEIGKFVDGIGRDFGIVIRHVALTATPRNPNQGPFETVLQFSLSELVPAESEIESLLSKSSTSLESQPESEFIARLRKQLNETHRQKCSQNLGEAKIPPGIRQRLAQTLPAVQFSEEGIAQPQFSMADVIELLDGSLPQQLRSDASSSPTASHPLGESFFQSSSQTPTEQDHEAAVDAQLKAAGFLI